jgi:hypothetical protein
MVVYFGERKEVVRVIVRMEKMKTKAGCSPSQ